MANIDRTGRRNLQTDSGFPARREIRPRQPNATSSRLGPCQHRGRSRSTNAFLNHLSIAHGSLMELATHLEIAMRIGYLKGDQVTESLTTTGEIGRMINGLKSSLAANPKTES